MEYTKSTHRNPRQVALWIQFMWQISKMNEVEEVLAGGGRGGKMIDGEVKKHTPCKRSTL